MVPINQERALQERRLRVVAACFGDLPEADFLQPATRGIATLEIIEERRHVLRHVIARRPSVLLVPDTDATGIPTKWIVLRCLERVPDLKVVVVLSANTDASSVLDLAISGALLVRVRSSHELGDAIRQSTRGAGLNAEEAKQIE